MTAREKERQEYREKLQDLLKPGETVFTVLRHVSRSGMYRAIDAYVMRDGRPFRISYWTAKACGMRYDQKHEAIGVGGCGMDMGFHVVYNLSATIFPNGHGCIGDATDFHHRCPSNDHSNGDRDFTSHSDKLVGWTICDDCCNLPSEVRATNRGCDKHSHWHADGGYALRHEWI